MEFGFYTSDHSAYMPYTRRYGLSTLPHGGMIYNGIV